MLLGGYMKKMTHAQSYTDGFNAGVKSGRENAIKAIERANGYHKSIAESVVKYLKGKTK